MTTIDDLPGPSGPAAQWLMLLRFARDPLAWWLDHGKRYADPSAFPFGRWRIPTTWHPDGIRDIFMAPPDKLGVFGPELIEPAVGKSSLLVLDGDRHRRERQLLAPAFHGERMIAYGALIKDVTRRAIDGVARGERFDIRKLTERISLEVIVRAVFGVVDEAQVAAAAKTVADAMSAVTPLVVFVQAARKDLGRFSPGGRLARAHAKGDAMLRGVIAERRRDETPRDDILSLVLALKDEHGDGLSDVEMIHELRTMLAAGHETTATALAWAVHYILRDERVLERTVAEAGDADPATLARSPWLSALCNETLRVRPIVADIIRMVKEPIVVAGVDVPAGTPVCAALPLLHRRPELYPEPEAFRPERFLERRFTPFEFAPFGGGVRRCLGADFALFEMRIVLGTLFARDRWQLVDHKDVATRLRNITVGPARPIEVIRL